jgi:hypothetical protein
MTGRRGNLPLCVSLVSRYPVLGAHVQQWSQSWHILAHRTRRGVDQEYVHSRWVRYSVVRPGFHALWLTDYSRCRIRGPVSRPKGDVHNDVRCGFDMIKARDIDRLGTDGVIRKLKDRTADSKVYISVDIDVLDPAFAPGK